MYRHTEATNAMSCSTRRMPVPVSSTKLRDNFAEALGLAHVETRGRLVEEQEAKGSRHGAGELDQPSLPGGEVARTRRRQRLYSAPRHCRPRSLGDLAPLAAASGDLAPWASGREEGLRAEGHVLCHRHGVEQLHPLERPSEPVRRTRRRGQVHQVLVAQPDLPGGRDHPGAGVERRGLAGAVGADEAGDGALGSVQGHVVYRDEPAEPHGQVLDGQLGESLGVMSAPPAWPAGTVARVTGRSARGCDRAPALALLGAAAEEGQVHAGHDRHGDGRQPEEGTFVVGQPGVADRR